MLDSGHCAELAGSWGICVLLCAAALFCDYLSALWYASAASSLPFWLTTVIKALLVVCASCLNLGGAGFVGMHMREGP